MHWRLYFIYALCPGFCVNVGNHIPVKFQLTTKDRFTMRLPKSLTIWSTSVNQFRSAGSSTTFLSLENIYRSPPDQDVLLIRKGD